MDPVAAWYVSNVLLGTPPPENGVAGRIGFKTGTSYGYRDAWSIGFDGKRTIGVWVGRPDGAPVPGLIGRAAAAPVLFDAFARMPGPPTPLPRAPKGVLVASSGKLPQPLRHFMPGRLASDDAQVKLHILFPPDGARLELASEGKPEPVAGEDRWRRGAAHRARQRDAGVGPVARKSLLSTGRARICAGDGYRRVGRDRQRSGCVKNAHRPSQSCAVPD